MDDIVLYADGAARGNGNKDALCGYGTVLLDFKNKRKKEMKYACIGATNNIMEIKAVIVGLKALKKSCNVDIYTDSQYVVNTFNKGWIYNWKSRGWIKGDGNPVKNKELWIELLTLVEYHNCTFNWVKGHSTNKWNNYCDQLANEAMDEYLSR